MKTNESDCAAINAVISEMCKAMKEQEEKEKQMRKLRRMAKKNPELKKEIRAIEKEKINEKRRTVIHRVKSYESACKELGIQPISPEKPYEQICSKRMDAVYKMSVIIKALNGGKRLKARDFEAERWYPTFHFSKPGSTFQFNKSVCERGTYNMMNGTLFALRTKELSDYCGKHFIWLWKDIIV